jgi:hypothetical protein
VIKKVGTTAGIDDVDFITPAEVRDKLAATDPETSTSRVLEAFLVAFQEWFEVTSVLVTDFDEDMALTHDQILVSNRRTQCKVELNIASFCSEVLPAPTCKQSCPCLIRRCPAVDSLNRAHI